MVSENFEEDLGLLCTARRSTYTERAASEDFSCAKSVTPTVPSCKQTFITRLYTN